MPLTLLTAGTHLRRNKRLLLASALCMSAHAALLLFGLQPTQTRAVTLDSLNATSALMLNLAASSAPSGAANTHAAADAKPAPQKSEPKKVVELGSAPVETAKPEQAKPVSKKESVSKKVAPKIPEKKASKKTEKKTEKKSKEKIERHNTTATARTSEPQPTGTKAHGAQKQPNAMPAPASTNGASSTASHATPAAAAQANGSNSKPRFRVPPSTPEYPKASRMRRQEGTVLLEVKLGNQGEQLQVVLLKSSGFPLLDRSALKAVKGWQFLPQEINGKGVSHVVRIPVRFALT